MVKKPRHPPHHPQETGTCMDALSHATSSSIHSLSSPSILVLQHMLRGVLVELVVDEECPHLRHSSWTSGSITALVPACGLSLIPQAAACARTGGQVCLDSRHHRCGQEIYHAEMRAHAQIYMWNPTLSTATTSQPHAMRVGRARVRQSSAPQRDALQSQVHSRKTWQGWLGDADAASGPALRH